MSGRADEPGALAERERARREGIDLMLRRSRIERRERKIAELRCYVPSSEITEQIAQLERSARSRRS